MAKAFAIRQLTAKVPRAPQLCNLGSRSWPYGLFCRPLPQEADGKAVGTQMAKKPTGAGPTLCWPIEADDKDGEGSRHQRCGGKKTAKPPLALTEASPIGCHLNRFADCSVSDTDDKELCRPLRVG